ncbi:MAG: hypothetical protein MJ204_03985 [Bacteroidales bacterium]|nr:hypothetical protein [Bacteroidales bacterium]
MKVLKKIIFIFFLLQETFCFAQQEVTVVVQGEGETKRTAIDVALRNAIEQSFGVFVSANTTILNDELVKDEIASISSGNIKEYKELKSITLPDGRTTVTLKAIVSIGQLVKYVESKGGSCELKGSAFVAELKQIQLKRNNTKIALEHLVTQLQSILPSAFDYEINAIDIQSTGEMTVVFESFFNENYFKCEDLIETTLEALSISVAEQNNLKSKGEDFFLYQIWNEYGSSILKQFYLYAPFEFNLMQPIHDAIAKNVIVDNLNHIIPLIPEEKYSPHRRGEYFYLNNLRKSKSRSPRTCYKSWYSIRYKEDEMMNLTGFTLKDSNSDLGNDLINLYKDYLENYYKYSVLHNSIRKPGVEGVANSFSNLEKPSIKNYFKLYKVGTYLYFSLGDRYVKYVNFDALDRSFNLRDPNSELTKEWRTIEEKHKLLCESFIFKLYDETTIKRMILETYRNYKREIDDDENWLLTH